MDNPAFVPIVKEARLHPQFNHLRTWAGSESARRMAEDVYADLSDPDGNFLEQFQTTGFDARYFELYLFAYFSRTGFGVDRSNPNPDFVVSRDGTKAAVEATTVNPSESGVLAKEGRKLSDLSEQEIHDYLKNELPIRFGSPLNSKLAKRYWELPQCKNLPFVIAVEAFHEENAQSFPFGALTDLLYGFRHTAQWDADGSLRVEATKIEEHRIGSKRVPSAFFDQEGAENISGVLFTNAGTNSKFARMGYQTGYGCNAVDMSRSGMCYNTDPDAKDPTYFSYNLDDSPFVEAWSQGLVLLHNPNCLHPVPKPFFLGACHGFLEGDLLAFECSDWLSVSSRTRILLIPQETARR